MRRSLLATAAAGEKRARGGGGGSSNGYRAAACPAAGCTLALRQARKTHHASSSASFVLLLSLARWLPLAAARDSSRCPLRFSRARLSLPACLPAASRLHWQNGAPPPSSRQSCGSVGRSRAPYERAALTAGSLETKFETQVRNAAGTRSATRPAIGNLAPSVAAAQRISQRPPPRRRTATNQRMQAAKPGEAKAEATLAPARTRPNRLLVCHSMRAQTNPTHSRDEAPLADSLQLSGCRLSPR